MFFRKQHGLQTPRKHAILAKGSGYGERFLPVVPGFVRYGAPPQYLKGIRIGAGARNIPLNFLSIFTDK
jgi:hypothetical protein